MRQHLRELLAAYAHEAWSGWMRYLFSKCYAKSANGEVTIPAWAVERWQRQMNTPYRDLPEDEKKSDREEADKILNVTLNSSRSWREALVNWRDYV